MKYSNVFKVSLYVTAIAAAALMAGCKVKYSLSGASIPVEAKTVSIAYFPNNAPMVAPVLSSTFTDALKDRFARQTRLTIIREGGDFNFEGEIVGYTSTPSSISGNEQAERNKLTITVKVRFTNAIEPQNSFDKTFSQFAEYPTSTLLQQAEISLIPEIVDMLIEDIFNAATSNW